jgi:outer membrane protein OmpA-like peptidoglycan-associated protein
MKKQLFLIGLIFTMFVAYSQSTQTKDETQPTAPAETVAEPKDDFCPHRIWMHLGGGYANNMFKQLRKDDIATTCSYTAMAELGYSYFFHRNFGVSLGVGINKSARIAKINTKGEADYIIDPVYKGDPDKAYDNLKYAMEGFKARHNVWALEIPLTVQFEKKFNGKNGIYGGLGVKGYIPIASKFHFPSGIIRFTEFYEWDINLLWTEDLPLDIHMDSKEFEGKQAIRPKMRPSIDIIGEFGGIFGISRRADFYIGAYASYGFLNILPNKEQPLELADFSNIDFKVTQIVDREGFMNTSKKWNLFNVGLKVGFHLKACKSCGNEKYMRDEKREFMDEMKKKKNEPIVVTNTVQEYYYFVPTISQELLDEAANDPAKKKALLDLAQSLSLIKILFDLDKDIPKLTPRNKDDINRVVEILKEHKDLKVIVSGYTSPEGTVPHNQDLGNRRAQAVRMIFVDKGVPGDQISTQNFTAQDPQHKIDIPEKEWPEQRAVIFKIEKR